MDDQNRNLLLATVLSALVILVWFLVFPPEARAPIEEEGAVSEAVVAPTPGTAEPEAPLAAPDREAALAEGARVPVETPRLSGSISLTGGRIDDLALTDYELSLDPDSPNVTLLSPVGGPSAYYALYGWAPGGDLPAEEVPGANTPWQLESGERLTPETPIVLRWESPSGLVFRREIAVDRNYLFTTTQTVENTSGAPVRLAPYGLIARHGRPEDLKGFFILHEGAIRMADGELDELNYNELEDLQPAEGEAGLVDAVEVTTDGWLGFTDHYWMTTLVPAPGQPFAGVARYAPAAGIYLTEARLPAVTVAPGETATSVQHLFAGAKEWEVINAYEDRLGFDRFVDAIDWGWFFFLTKPIFMLLHWLNGLIGNMGWSIIALTFLIKAVLFPLAYKSYVSMARMKELQPEMEKIKERTGDDRMKMQQEVMALYKRERVNPAAGCLPLLLQIPIFFSLYKVIFVTIELRHAEWVGWIRDLSAPDPSSIYNLFGLLPWAAPDPGSLLATIFIGVLPIVLGISMWLQQKLNPAPADPTQAMIFAYMPWLFMFMLGGFASGLVVYWIANNTITFTQQYIIMRSHGSKPDIFGNIRSGFRRRKPAPEKK